MAFLPSRIIQDLIAHIVGDIGALYKASEAVISIFPFGLDSTHRLFRWPSLICYGHLRMPLSVCRSYLTGKKLTLTGTVRNYGKFNAIILNITSIRNIRPVRPEFTGTLAIKSGRHPILETLHSVATLVPNDVYCDDSSSFQLIQGPKSVHLLSVFVCEERSLTCLITFLSMSGECHCLVMMWLYCIDIHRRQKHLPPPSRSTRGNGPMWLLRSCRICELQVRNFWFLRRETKLQSTT